MYKMLLGSSYIFMIGEKISIMLSLKPGWSRRDGMELLEVQGSSPNLDKEKGKKHLPTKKR